MVLYPERPRARASAIVIDVVVLLLLIFCLQVGQSVQHSVGRLDSLGRGVQDAGRALDDGLQRAGRTARDVPLVGDDVEDGLARAGRSSGGRLADAGRTARREIDATAELLGWVAGGVPAAVIVALWLPGRVRAIRRLGAAHVVLRAALPAPASGPAGGGDALGAERRRIAATRAAMTLPYATLATYTRDPFGDLATGNLDGLLRALHDDAGLRWRG